MARAELAGAPGLFGWTHESEAIASLYELIEVFMRMFAQKRGAGVDLYPNRPNVEHRRPLSIGEAASYFAAVAVS